MGSCWNRRRARAEGTPFDFNRQDCNPVALVSVLLKSSRRIVGIAGPRVTPCATAGMLVGSALRVRRSDPGSGPSTSELSIDTNDRVEAGILSKSPLRLANVRSHEGSTA